MYLFRNQPIMNKVKLYFLIIPIWVSACIGTDIVEDVLVPEAVSINNAIDSLKVGEMYTFSADYFDNIGKPGLATIQWFSTNSSIISIQQNGVASALSEGNVYIKAVVGQTADSVKVNAGATTSSSEMERGGSFMGRNNYTVTGDFQLMQFNNGLQLTFADNFRASNGPGLFVYLSNQNTGVSGGVEIGRLMSNSGSQTYTIPGNVTLNTYNYIVIYCKPFGVPFGAGKLN